MRPLFTIFILFFLASKTYSIDFKELETKNISFWFVEDNSVPVVSISFTIFGGSSLDPAGKDGLTNLMVSLMDEGTEKYSGTKLRELMKLNGVKLRLSSQKNKIDGTFQVISTQLKEGFEILDQILNYPKFLDEEISKVKKQIYASLKIDESDISTLANYKFNEIFFENHRFSKRIKGSEKSLKNISRVDLINHHKSLFTIDSLVIGAAGDIDANSIKNYVKDVFGKFSVIPNNIKMRNFDDIPSGQKIIQAETPQSSVVFGHPGLARNHSDYFKLRVANYILGGGGFQSRLYKQIREKKGLVYSIYSYPISYKHDGIMIGGFQTRNESVYETIKNVKEEWSKISNRGITKKELAQAKAYYKGSFTRNFTSTLSIANLLNIVQFYNLGNDYFDKRDKIIESLKLEEINDMLKDIYDSNKLFFLIVGKPVNKK